MPIIQVELTTNQVRALIIAAEGTAAVYRDSEDADPSFKLQSSARSLEQAILRLKKVVP